MHAPKYQRRLPAAVMLAAASTGASATTWLVNGTFNETSTQAAPSLPATAAAASAATTLLLDGLTCGEIKKERGIQRLEAMLYAIDLVSTV